MTWQLIAAVAIAVTALIGYLSLGGGNKTTEERSELPVRPVAPPPVRATPADPAVVARFQQALNDQISAARR